MERRNIFPVDAAAESFSDSSVKLEGQRMLFDKKVSLLPVDIRREAPAKVKKKDGRA